MKRSGKFYRKNEAEVMESLGLKPTKNSGSGWIEKEDGQDENVICQLKSTDKESIKVNQLDLHKLEYNANVSHKIPLFALQFLNSNEVWLMVKPEDLRVIGDYINHGIITDKLAFSQNLFYQDDNVFNNESKKIEKNEFKRISSSKNARNKFHEEINKKYDKTKGAI